MKNDVAALKAVVKIHSEDIQALKKAQYPPKRSQLGRIYETQKIPCTIQKRTASSIKMPSFSSYLPMFKY